jgi:hypothetical protein
MDTPSEDTMVRQIEKKLSDHMNENLFLTGRSYENNPVGTDKNALIKNSEQAVISEANRDYPLVSNEYISNSPGISRAEYIRQAREACLRQISSIQIYSRPYEVNYMEMEATPEEQLNQKKAKVMKMFHVDEGEEEKASLEAGNKVRDVLSYRSLIIRSVCAIVLFLSIFLLEKFNIEVGSFSHHMIKEYVTGNDALKQLESILVTWLK